MLIQKYRNLKNYRPIVGRQVILYFKIDPEQGYSKVGTYVLKSVDQNSLLFEGEDVLGIGTTHIVRSENYENYQYVDYPPLNKIQKLAGRYYLGFPLIGLIIYGIIKLLN